MMKGTAPKAGAFLADVRKLRRRARVHMKRGAVTERRQANLETVALLNTLLATELVCVLWYRRHYFMASGIHAQAVAAEFLMRATQEQEHADRIAHRITQLGGDPDFNPKGLATRSQGSGLEEMIGEDLVAERIGIDFYGEMIRYFGNDDPTSRRLIEEILAQEEGHAEDLKALIVTLGCRDRRGKKPATPTGRRAVKRIRGRE